MTTVADDQLAALEARIVEDPDDLDGWLVLADLLQKRGDPHGELIALQIAADRDPPANKKSPARLAFTRAFAKHAPRLLGSLSTHGASLKDPAAEPFVWRTGFLRRASIVEPTLEQRATEPAASVVLGHLLAQPAARFLSELAIRVSGSDEVRAILDTLVARPPPLHELELFARAHVDDLAVIWKHFPRLRRISLLAHRFDLDGLELPEARRASFMTLAFSAASMAAVATAPWPVLERLELRVGTTDRDTIGNLSRTLGRPDLLERLQTPATFEDIAPLLRRTDLPALTHLRVRNAPFAGAVLRAIIDSPLAAQLQVLDLSAGTLTPQDIKYASQRKAALAQLRELWVPQITQWSGVAADLAGMAKHIVTKAPLDLLEQELATAARSDRLEGVRE